MSSVDLSRPLDGVAVMRLNRPEVRNALDSATLVEVLTALRDVCADESVRCLVMSTTSTTALCAGADVGERLDAAGGVWRMELFCELYSALAGLPMPAIAVCVGNVLGAGTEIAAGLDVRIAGDNLRLGWVGIRNGVPVGPGRLVPLVGEARARELIFTGRTLGAGEALELGLVSSVHPAAEAEAAAFALAEEIASRPAARAMKALFTDLADVQVRTNIEAEALLTFQRCGAGLPGR